MNLEVSNKLQARKRIDPKGGRKIIDAHRIGQQHVHHATTIRIQTVQPTCIGTRKPQSPVYSLNGDLEGLLICNATCPVGYEVIRTP